MSHDVEPFPALHAWRTIPWRGAVTGILIFLLFTVFFGVQGVFNLARSEWYGAVSMLALSAGWGFDVLALFRAQVLRRMSRAPMRGVTLQGRRLQVRLDEKFVVLDLVSAVLVVTGMLMFAVGVPRRLMDFPFAGEGARLIYPAAALIVAIYYARETIARSRNFGESVRLSEAGISTWSLGREPIRWPASGVRPIETRGDRNIGTRVSIGPTENNRSVRVDNLSIGAPAMLWLLDFYARHPELREELSDGRSIARLRSGAVVEMADRYA
ncbi:hypothetical protein [Gordonia soli]|uniref:Uncharacterized protein n=1 Tax=Gordonia soli NBRC 108243 TaxID=1223545 RepID=M0QCN7_9ACTN|nr:hypothetical protein [Gordonia soli]GAC66330.1 hypothetical protein GS4_02_00400 [Gordonia soli NBRC 108243]